MVPLNHHHRLNIDPLRNACDPLITTEFDTACLGYHKGHPRLHLCNSGAFKALLTYLKISGSLFALSVVS